VSTRFKIPKTKLDLRREGPNQFYPINP
jgi:hypothetical protein